MKTLLMLLAVVSCSAATADVYVLGLSHHWRTREYREENPGLGLGYAIDVSAHGEILIAGLAYKDSLGRTGTAAGGGYRHTVGRRESWHGTATVLAGYLDGSGYAGPVIAPILGAGWGAVNVEAAYNPERETAAAWLRFSWTLH